MLVSDQRRQRGMTQSELVEKVGVSRPWLGQLEKGKQTVEVGLVIRTLHALGLALDVSPQKEVDFDFGTPLQ